MEAADNGLLARDLAAAIARVKGAKRHGVRAGNWLTLDQTERLLALPSRATQKGRRDRALLALLVGCGLRRQELAGLRIGDIQQRDGAGASWTWPARGTASGLSPCRPGPKPPSTTGWPRPAFRRACCSAA
jgi:integrase